jgi:hypothetical protein
VTTDYWFTVILFIGVWLCALMLLDGAHRAHIAALRHAHREQVAGLRSYIRTLSRERLWLEAEVQRLGDKMDQQRDKVRADFDAWATEQSLSKPEHIQWLPPSEEYGEGEE